MAAVKVKLPDYLDFWPWQREINPYYEEVKREATAWGHSFGFFDKKSQDAFDRCAFCKVACLTYPYMNRAQALAACKLMVLFYVYDEFTDIEGPKVGSQLASIVMDALRNPHKPRPAGEFAIGELARQFWAEATLVASPMAQRHFIETFQEYVDAVTEQAADREADRVRTLEEYWPIRDHTGGCPPAFAFIELDLDFPEELYRSPELERLREIANRSITGCNDVYSYNVERARGHALHNIVTVAMYEKNIDVQDALKWFNDWHNGVLREFLALREEVDVLVRKQHGEAVAKQVRFYVNGLGRWVRGNDDWHFEGQRHFGEMGLEIQKTREVLMLPKIEAALPVIGPGATTVQEGGKGWWHGRSAGGAEKNVVERFSGMVLAIVGFFRKHT
ncbi:terpenoid synthase [Immersiella caudata]|uniref:Terpene synthase n=1 Tax=Immersiella caudata TaxID=314043 RepID=A0AA39WA81_9PEZI|nr:terpenoid synthase [Immersiella caudata]